MEKKKKVASEEKFNNLAKAVAYYIMDLGGSAVAVGGIRIGREIGALKYNYFIQISITGKIPKAFEKKLTQS